VWSGTEEVAMTTDKGAFDIQVPYWSSRYNSWRKPSHYYSEEDSESGTHDFQQKTLREINFKDVTFG